MKKKQSFTLLIVVLLGMFIAKAQNSIPKEGFSLAPLERHFCKHEIGVSWGGGSNTVNNTDVSWFISKS